MNLIMQRLCLILLSSLLLSACSTFKITTNEGPYVEDFGTRTDGMALEDDLIKAKVENHIKYNNAIPEAANIQVDSYNRIVLLTGQVPNSNIQQQAVQMAQNVRNVRSVHDELVIGPSIGFNQKAADNFLKTRVRLRLMSDQLSPSDRVEIRVENSVVYLMGLVTRKEADNTINAALRASGIKKVVKVFEYIDN